MAKATKTIHITTTQLLKVMRYCVKNDLALDNADFLLHIGVGPNNLNNIEKGVQGFNKDHIRAARLIYNVNFEYIYGFSSNMFIEKKETEPLQLLKAAVHAVEEEFKKVKMSNKKSNKT